MLMLLFYFFVAQFSLYWFLVLGIIWLFFTSIGSFNILLNYHIDAINYEETEEKVIALTFDDGPNPNYTEKILDLLRQYNAEATFFCIGKNCEQHPDILKRIDSENHIIANHTYTHPSSFGFLNSNQVEKEISKTTNVIEDIIGKKPKFFRPPFGVTNPSIKKAVENLKITTFGWNIRSLDTVLKEEKKVLKRIIPNIKPGAIILLHDVQENSIPVLEQLLRILKEQKYKAVSLETLTNIKAYE
ncbi:peptidoglycan/xylan/chitin deacetylase (PgdA/CDA1 family) [Tenacibaculum caenipelagi]|uniref:Peptidoglycan/xylan/chitin deacetylase (PgdA/CDA1 family) n=2 Tax=Tenacibaculum caenipelagi TaxID=1325435 RepID=A0A4R6TL26_9FLAO|nr:peptidoglycan/xylan/chitin deacetylase (PgdA/CDA1 family) [Tenacibaculum caenipelagi]